MNKAISSYNMPNPIDFSTQSTVWNISFFPICSRTSLVNFSNDFIFSILSSTTFRSSPNISAPKFLVVYFRNILSQDEPSFINPFRGKILSISSWRLLTCRSSPLRTVSHPKNKKLHCPLSSHPPSEKAAGTWQRENPYSAIHSVPSNVSLL